jgi:hypothetical protein
MNFDQGYVAKKFHHGSTAIISRWEKGLSMPSGTNLMILSRLYKVPIQSLYPELDRQIVKDLYGDKPETFERKPRGSDP